MKEAYQLIKLIKKFKQTSQVPLINLNDKNSLETKLYQHLEEMQLSDEEAVEILYGSSEKKNAFKMLKSRFKKKLYNELIFLNHNHKRTNELITTEIDCSKLLLEARILSFTGDNNLAEKHVKQVLRIAKNAGLTNEVVRALELYRKILMNQASSVCAYNECKIELDKYYMIQEYERSSTTIHHDISLKVRLGVASKLEVLKQLESATEKLLDYWNISASPMIFIQYHKLKMIHFELNGDYHSQIEFINKTNQLYDKGLIDTNYFPLSLNKYAFVYACLRCGRYEEGTLAAEKLKSELLESSHNWFSNMENYFLLYFHDSNYSKAGGILNEVLNSPFFSKVKPYQKESWYLFFSFYQLLTNNELTSLSKIKIKSSAETDKKGLNIWLIILNFLTLLKQENHEQLYQNTEKIRKYISKYLDSKSDPRNKLFLKLLLLVVKEDFDPVRCRQKSRYLFQKLSQLAPAGDAYAEVEIVPFEHLWEFILNLLEKQKRSIVKH